jgi:prepilin-type N-terminal cleavage/methylation domain-containing protein
MINQKGFTILEILVAMGVMLAFMVAYVQFYQLVKEQNRSSHERLIGLVSMISILEEIRDMSFNDLVDIGSYSFQNGAGQVEVARIQYDLCKIKVTYRLAQNWPQLIMETMRSAYE